MLWRIELWEAGFNCHFLLKMCFWRLADERMKAELRLAFHFQDSGLPRNLVRGQLLLLWKWSLLSIEAPSLCFPFISSVFQKYTLSKKIKGPGTVLESLPTSLCFWHLRNLAYTLEAGVGFADPNMRGEQLLTIQNLFSGIKYSHITHLPEINVAFLCYQIELTCEGRH